MAYRCSVCNKAVDYQEDHLCRGVVVSPPAVFQKREALPKMISVENKYANDGKSRYDFPELGVKVRPVPGMSYIDSHAITQWVIEAIKNHHVQFGGPKLQWQPDTGGDKISSCQSPASSTSGSQTPKNSKPAST